MQGLAKQTLDTRWVGAQHMINTRIPHRWQRWLKDSGSLTQHLIKASHGHFSVELVSQSCARPNLKERQALSLPARQLAVIREVKLKGNADLWVYARTIIPVTSLKGRLRQLHHIGNRSLGSVLFSDRSMRRSPIEVCQIADPSGQNLYARRSLFWLSGYPLLVSEVFLPELLRVNYQP